MAFESNHEAGVTKISRGLGTYWPKDIVRLLGLEAGDRLLITPTGPHKMAIEVVKGVK